MSKEYYGKCGSCKYCELGTAYTFAYSTSFKCSRNGYSVKADEKPCNKYEPAPGVICYKRLIYLYKSKREKERSCA